MESPWICVFRLLPFWPPATLPTRHAYQFHPSLFRKYEVINLKVIHRRNSTGFEQVGDAFAGRPPSALRVRATIGSLCLQPTPSWYLCLPRWCVKARELPLHIGDLI